MSDAEFSETDLAWFNHPLASPRPPLTHSVLLESPHTTVEVMMTLVAVAWVVVVLALGAS